ncbi:MAG: IclR family transcriptional regulator [Acidobacteriota bacterium]|nr:IclR family transcriptional regulator [Acidobacteriota bacterium]
MEAAKKSSVPALERGLTVVELLARSRGGLTLSQVTRYLELPKSSVFCLLHTLDNSGYVYKDADSGKYRLSLRVCGLADLALNGIGLRDQARPHLRRLAESTGMTVHLAVLEQGACILIEKISRPDVNPVATWVGKHLSFHCTALGKVLAAYLAEEELATLIREHGLMRHNDCTICSPKRLKKELASVRERGYAIDDEEEEIGVRCAGAPVFNASEKVVAAVSVVASATELHAGNMDRIARHLMAVANDISDQVKAAPGREREDSSVC